MFINPLIPQSHSHQPTYPSIHYVHQPTIPQSNVHQPTIPQSNAHQPTIPQSNVHQSTGSSGLSSGAVAGVVLGVMAILAVAGVAGFLGRRYILAQSPGPNVIASQGYDNATYTTTAGGGDKVSLAVSSDA